MHRNVEEIITQHTINGNIEALRLMNAFNLMYETAVQELADYYIQVAITQAVEAIEDYEVSIGRRPAMTSFAPDVPLANNGAAPVQ